MAEEGIDYLVFGRFSLKWKIEMGQKKKSPWAQSQREFLMTNARGKDPAKNNMGGGGRKAMSRCPDTTQQPLMGYKLFPRGSEALDTRE